MKKQSIIQCVAVLTIASAAGMAARGQGTRGAERATRAVGISREQDRADVARLKKEIANFEGQKPRLEYELNVARDKMNSVNASLRMMYQRQAELTARLNRQARTGSRQ